MEWQKFTELWSEMSENHPLAKSEKELKWIVNVIPREASLDSITTGTDPGGGTVKPVCSDHLYDKIY